MLATLLLLLGFSLEQAISSPLPNEAPQLALQPPIAQTPAASTDLTQSLRQQHALSDLRLQQHVSSLPEKRIVRFADKAREVQQAVITEGEKALLVLSGIHFIDVTEELQSGFDYAATRQASTATPRFPDELAYVGQLEHLYSAISIARMESKLSKFSSFRTRYYRSAEGKQSQAWLLQTVNDIAALDPNLGITVKEFEHPWGQNSIILHIPRMPTSQSSAEDNLVIVGAHQDSTNLLPFLPAPGADDDGSGTTTSLEALTLLVQSGFRPANSSVEFHWYSAEEGGMLGSSALASSYQKEGKSVKAMLQMDMTAYVKPGTEERVGIIQDYVDPNLTKFIEKLIKHHLDIPSVPTKCGYACSDHASFTSKGWPAAFAIEATFEDSNTGNIHSGRDTIKAEGFSFDHMAQFVKLVLAFTHELS